VLAREDVPGDKRLVAYLVAREAPLPGPSELRSHLQSKLPDYMVPAAFVELSALPLTSNGKIDRRALPAPDRGEAAADRPFVAPRTPTEAAIAAIWQEVLGVPRVGVHHDFFELGGHSILAAQAMARIVRDLHVELPLRAIFEAKTVAALAELVDLLLNTSGGAAPPPAGTDVEEGEL
jgi:acyl carrier protein